MSIPTPTCTTLKSPPSAISVQMPGGLTLESMPMSGDTVSSELSSIQGLMVQLAPALAGLKPIFVLIDTVVAIKDTLTSLPGLVAGDVQPFFDALDRVISGVATLVSMAPQASIPVLIMDIAGVLTQALRVIETLLTQVIDIQQDVQNLKDAADRAPAAIKADMELQAGCLDDLADSMTEHAIASLGPVGSILKTLTSLSDLAPGMPALPSLGDLTGQSAEDIKESITTIREVLEALVP